MKQLVTRLGVALDIFTITIAVEWQDRDLVLLSSSRKRTSPSTSHSLRPETSVITERNVLVLAHME